jgi:hypothetical protein
MKAKSIIFKKDNNYQTIEAKYEYNLEEDLEQYSTNNPKKIKQEVNLEIKLMNDGLIHVNGDLINKIKNYRLRLNVKSNIKAMDVISDTSYSFIRRELEHKQIGN